MSLRNIDLLEPNSIKISTTRDGNISYIWRGGMFYSQYTDSAMKVGITRLDRSKIPIKIPEDKDHNMPSSDCIVTEVDDEDDQTSE